MSYHYGIQKFELALKDLVEAGDIRSRVRAAVCQHLLHLDENYCRENTEFGQRVVNSCLTLGLMVGISVNDTTHGTAVANLGWDEVRFPKPVFHGDTLRIETEVLDLRESTSRPDQGIVTYLHRAFNQHGDLVAHCKRSGLQLKKPADSTDGDADGDAA